MGYVCVCVVCVCVSCCYVCERMGYVCERGWVMCVCVWCVCVCLRKSMLGVNNTGTAQSDRDNEVFISRMSCPCLTSDPTCSFNDRPSPLSLRMIDCCTGTPRALIGRERRQEEVGEGRRGGG